MLFALGESNILKTTFHVSESFIDFHSLNRLNSSYVGSYVAGTRKKAKHSFMLSLLFHALSV